MHRMTRLALATAALIAAPLVAIQPPATATTISSAPRSSPEVKGLNGHDGEVLTTTVGTVAGVKSIVIGGNFDYLTTPDGKNHTATNLAAVSFSNPNRITYAGNVNGFVRSVYVGGGAVYVGGDFTAAAGQSRAHIARFDATTMRLSAWNPGAADAIRAIAGNGSKVVVAGASSDVTEYSIGTGRKAWNQKISGGPARTLMFNPNGKSVYVGGQFETYAGRTQHGLVRASAATGVPSAFNSHFRPDQKSSYDGDCVLSLAWDAGHGRLIVGSGGNTRNSLWSLNPASGSWGGSGWGRQRIPSEGDVQAVAVAGNRIVTGFHRNHPNKVAPKSNRFMNTYSAASGAFVPGDVGLWGTQRNEAHSNNGVSSLTYSSGLLIVGGAFRGYGSPFLNTGTPADTEGTPGTRQQGLLLLPTR